MFTDGNPGCPACEAGVVLVLTCWIAAREGQRRRSLLTSAPEDQPPDPGEVAVADATGGERQRVAVERARGARGAAAQQPHRPTAAAWLFVQNVQSRNPGRWPTTPWKVSLGGLPMIPLPRGGSLETTTTLAAPRWEEQARTVPSPLSTALANFRNRCLRPTDVVRRAPESMFAPHAELPKRR